MYQSEYKVTIHCDGAASNQIDRLSILLQQFAQAENLSVHISVLQPQYVAIVCHGKRYQCHREALRYLTSDGHYCICHLTTGDVRLRISFADAAAQLATSAPDTYWTVARGVLLNHTHIIDHTRDAFVMDDGASFTVSRKDRARLFAAFDRL